MTSARPIAYNTGSIRPGVVGGLTLYTETLKHEHAAIALERWLDTRSGSERATLARLWALPESVAQSGAALAQAMCDPAALGRVLAALRPRERAALTLVQQHGGSIAAPILEREFGAVRALASYPNPRAYLLALEQPLAPTERLWALGLLLAPPDRPARVYSIPAELQALLPPAPARQRQLGLSPLEPPASQATASPAQLESALLRLLALAQDGGLAGTAEAPGRAALKQIAAQLPAGASPHYPRWLYASALGASLLKLGVDDTPRPARAAIEWLRAPAIERTRRLLEAWIESPWDELAELAGVTVQRPMLRDLPAARRAALALLGQAAPGQWYALDELVAQVRQVEPDFARPDGRYDTWGLLGRARQPLDGFVHWERVEGQQLRAIVAGPLHWLGLASLAFAEARALAFCLTPAGAALLSGAEPPPEPPPEPLLVQANFEVLAPPYATLYARFQLGRFAERGSAQPAETYRLTRQSIHRALQRGILVDDLLRFLREHSATDVPSNVSATLREWAGQYGRVSLRHGTLLEADDALLLEQIRRDRRVRLPRVEQLGERAWLLRPADAPALAERLSKAGYGVANQAEPAGAPLREHDLTVAMAALEFYAQACAALALEHDASAALRKRVARLLSEKQLNRAHQASREALQRLREHLRLPNENVQIEEPG